ncbi:MAG TPA: DUF547 domain-containing protein [Oligoflexia bacterium]|nr:DUF547 domain-containing protein [Oligoflexia bacterium]HMR25587.1 DUF547 domain-containing protein [Oligoflexia bacterium]
MKKNIKHGIVAIMVLMVLSACVRKIPRLNSKAEIDHVQAIKAYASVLSQYVNDQGQVDFKCLVKQQDDLNLYVHYIAHTPFSEFTSKNALLAHMINSYNAMSMYNVLESFIPQTNQGFGKIRFFFLTKLHIAQKKMSLYTLENKYIRKKFDERIHFALNCMSVSCPVLPKKPFTADNIEQELNEARRIFFSEKRNLEINSDNKTVYVSEILSFYKDDFISEQSPTLIDYINLHTDLNIPKDYKIKFIPYDWTIHGQG